MALLCQFIHDELHRALSPVLEHERHILDPAPQVRIPEKYFTPHFRHCLGWVAIYAQAEVTNDHGTNVVVHADCQRGPELGLGQFVLFLKGVACPIRFQLGPAGGYDGNYGECVPFGRITVLVAVVWASKDN